MFLETRFEFIIRPTKNIKHIFAVNFQNTRKTTQLYIVSYTVGLKITQLIFESLIEHLI